MIVDSSVIVAVTFGEPDEDVLLETMASSPRLWMSVANWLECYLVVENQLVPPVTSRLEALLSRLRIELMPVTVEQAHAARLAHQRFGRGRHPAKLNYGDCFAYALAKTTREPLLFKGNDFSQTDIEPALKAA